MNSGLSDEHVTIEYYDSDYPSAFFGDYPENLDEITEFQGVRYDVDRYIDIAREIGGPVLELCSGTGRVAIPLAREGFEITGVDLSEGILERFRHNLANEPDEVRSKINLVHASATDVDLGEARYGLIICAFNSLLVIPDADDQLQLLKNARRYLTPGGRLVVDVVNPLTLSTNGSDMPKPFYTRRNTHTGLVYTRFAMASRFDANQCQRLHGWYDEIGGDGVVRRRQYSMHWRPVFRFELEFMLRMAGLDLMTVEGGHRGEEFKADSPHIFVQAVLAGEDMA